MLYKYFFKIELKKIRNDFFYIVFENKFNKIVNFFNLFICGWTKNTIISMEGI